MKRLNFKKSHFSKRKTTRKFQIYELFSLKITYWNITDSEDNRGFTPEYFKRRRRRDAQATLDGYVMKYQYFFGSKFANGANLVNATADQMHQATVAAVNSGGIGPESEMVEFLSAMRSKCFIYSEKVNFPTF